MRILLLGEASFVHSTLMKGFRELGHDVVLMSDGNNGRECPRDVDLERNMKWGKLGGLHVLWKLFMNISKLFGNDIVQIHNSQFVPLKMWWNKILLIILKLGNKKVVKCCLGDDTIVMDRQARGILRYSDTHIGKIPINVEQNSWRIEEQNLPDYVSCCHYANANADALVPCLYEYFVYYDIPEYHDKLHYVPLPMEIPENKNTSDGVKKTGIPVKVLIGIQEKRDYIKGASVIAELVENIALENPGMIEITKIFDVPYEEYLNMLAEADVLVDQLYSYTPSMNSLAAMACGAVVVGGGEEEFYEFIGEKTLRPIINVRPGEDEYNLKVLGETLLCPVRLDDLRSQGIEFVRKHHDYLKVSGMYIDLYEKLLYGSVSDK